MPPTRHAGGLFWGPGGNGSPSPAGIPLMFAQPTAPESDPSPAPRDLTDENPIPQRFHPALPVDQHTYHDNLGSVPARPRKRPHPSHTRSTLSSSTTTTTHSLLETRAKRRALETLTPSTRFGTTLRPAIFPPHVRDFLRHFAQSEFEQRCLPYCPAVEAALDHAFSHELFPVSARLEVSPSDHAQAVAFLDFATRIHSTCTRNSVKALDEAAWHPCVRSLLSVDPPEHPSTVPTLPPPDAHDPSAAELFLTLDATTKTTRKSVLPNYPNIKLDHLLVFNAEHALVQPTAALTREQALVINAFADTSIDDVPIALGVEVKAAGGSEGPTAAEFQLGVWAAKTLSLSSSLAGTPQTAACDIAVGLSVCGHVWAMHVTYWNGQGALVAHGPVIVGSTDTLYGTLKIVAWVVRFKVWAAERLLPDWVERVASA